MPKMDILHSILYSIISTPPSRHPELEKQYTRRLQSVKSCIKPRGANLNVYREKNETSTYTVAADEKKCRSVGEKVLSNVHILIVLIVSHIYNLVGC